MQAVARRKLALLGRHAGGGGNVARQRLEALERDVGARQIDARIERVVAQHAELQQTVLDDGCDEEVTRRAAQILEILEHNALRLKRR